MRVKILPLILLLTFSFSLAAIPQQISIQGRLTDTSGVVDGIKSFVFTIYDAQTGGSNVWSESVNLNVDNGFFHHVLGTVTPLNLDFDKEYWLEIQVDGETLSPRHKLTSSPYGLNSLNLITSGKVNVDSGTLYVDSTNSRVGIRTYTPGAFLDIVPDENTLNISISSSYPTGGPNTVGFYSKKAEGDFVVPSSDKLGLGHYDESTNTVVLDMVIDQNGKIGINTTSPEKLLHLNYSGTNKYLLGIVMERLDNTYLSKIFLKTGSGYDWSFGENTNEDDFVITRESSGDVFTIKPTGNVGIGTTSPSAKLEVNGGKIRVNTPSTSGAEIEYAQDGTRKWAVGIPANSNSFNFYKDGLGNVITLTDTGNVGIGTNNPSSNLDIYSSTGDSSITIRTGTATWFHIYQPNNVNQLRVSTGSGATGTADIMTISGGNIGIGTNNPFYKLDVVGDVHIRDNLYIGPTNLMRLDEDGNSGYLSYNGGIRALDFDEDEVWVGDETIYVDGTNHRVGIGTTSPAYTLTVSGIIRGEDKIIATNDIESTSGNLHISGTGNSYIMGNLGIGTTSPTFKLDVNPYSFQVGDSSNIDGGLINTSYEGTSAYLNLYEYDEPFIIRGVQTNTNNKATIVFNQGRIGINTISPAYTLDINGNAGVRGSLQLHGNNIELNTAGGNYINATTDVSSNNYATHITNKGGVIIEIDGDNNAGSYPDNDVFKVKDASNTLFVVRASDDRVGIGTTSPQSKLHLYDGYFLIETSDDNMITLKNKDTASGSYWSYLKWVENDDTPMYWMGTDSSGNFGLAAYSGYSSKNIYFNNINKVGIGITSPSYTLDVNGDINAQNRLCINGDCRNSWPSGVSGSGSTSHLARWTSSSNLGNSIIYDNGNKVGIHIASPSFDLHIEKLEGENADASMCLNTETASRSTWIYFQNRNSTKAAIGVRGGDKFTIFKNGADRFVIDDSGRIGIGTTSPSYKLDIYGGGNDVYERIRSTKTDGIAGLNLVNDARSWVLRVNSDDKFQIRDATSGAERLVIDTSGNSHFIGHLGVGIDPGSSVFKLICPSGFLSVDSGTAPHHYQLGCIQIDEADSGNTKTWEDAMQYCFTHYGGRLPTAAEWFAGVKNVVTMHYDDDWEWTADVTGSNSYVLVNLVSWHISTSSDSRDHLHSFRCWIDT